MRVISQNGKYDVPFERCAFTCEGTMIHALFGCVSVQWLFAQYESSEKAQKAMEMMHDEFTGIISSLIIDHEGMLDMESIEVLRKSKVGAVISTRNHGDVEYHMLPRIFKFPADDEIEVQE